MKQGIGISIVLFFSIHFLGFAQSDCTCLSSLDSLRNKIGLNYAGYEDKVNEKTRSHYGRMVQELRALASKSPDRRACFKLLARYVNFFEDKHLQIGDYHPDDFTRIYEFFTEKDARQLLRNASIDSPEGIWIEPSGEKKLAILKDGKRPGIFKALVIQSSDSNFKPGQLYYRLQNKGGFYEVESLGNALLSAKSRGKHYKNLFYNYGPWMRQYPHQPDLAEQREFEAWKNNGKGLMCYKMTDSVVCLKIPTFGMQGNQLESFVNKYDSLIRATPYLIVDVRHNGGGNIGMEVLLPYLCSEPFVVKGGLMKSSEDNNRAFESDYAGDTVLVRILRQNVGKLVSQPDLSLQYEPLPNPKKVVILQNDQCGSATEYSLQIVKNFKKVTTMGGFTMGMMDYGDLRGPADLPCRDFKCVIPMVKSPWTDTEPIDRTGIKPEIRILLPEYEWPARAVEYLQGN